jgi:hypothetical protein
MTTIRAVRHLVAPYFVLTFAISWGGVLLVIGGSSGMTGMKAQDNPVFPEGPYGSAAGTITASTRWSTTAR